MRLSQAWIVTRHDMSLFRKKRGVFFGLVLFPIAVGIGFPLLVGQYILPHGGAATANLWLPSLIDAFSFWFVIGGATLPTSIASYSIVGEKVSKSLEPLLATPTTDGEILLGKGLAALLPTLGAMWTGSILFQVLMDVETRGALGYLYYPNAAIVVIMFVVMPLAALLAIEASVVISSQVTDVRSAQQYSGLIFLPFIFLYIAAEISLTLNATNLLKIAGGLSVVDLALFYTSLRTFHRDEILTRWK
jgi:ABC-2 type transport system permease protein